MLVIGHLPKSKEGKEAGFSGSTAWEASVTVDVEALEKQGRSSRRNQRTMNLWRLRGSSYWTLEHTKSNYARIQQPVYLAKQEKGWWSEADDLEDAAEAFDAYQKGVEHQPQEDTRNDALAEIDFPSVV